MAKAKKSSTVVKVDKTLDTSELKPEPKDKSKSIISKDESLEKGKESKEQSSKPVEMEQVQENADTGTIIRILYHGSCPKLTMRGVSELEYEIGVNEITDEAYLRIAGNASSGAFSMEWIAFSGIRILLENAKEESFRAVVLRDLYSKRSSNNHGYLGAILKAEGVFISLPKQPAVMQMGGWETLLKKIDSLRDEGISLTDHIAIAANKRAERKAQLLLEKQMAKDDKEKERVGKVSVAPAKE